MRNVSPIPIPNASLLIPNYANLSIKGAPYNMNAQEIIEYIRTSEKKTPVKVYVWENAPVAFPNCREFPAGEGCKIVFGDWKDVAPILEANEFAHVEIENNCRNSAIPMLDMKNIPARIEPGAIINIGAVIGDGTMIDMGAVLGGRATVGRNCHVGAGAVLAGVIEPASATPVIVEDNVLIGTNAVVIEGCRIGANAVVAAGAIVVGDVPANAVVAGCPGKIIKMKDEKTTGKTALVDALREL